MKSHNHRHIEGSLKIYLWAGLLFVGLPLVSEVLAWFWYQYLGLNWDQEPAGSWPDAYGISLLIFVIQTLLYFFVRRLGHTLLSPLWLYAVASAAIGLVTVPIMEQFDDSSVAHARVAFLSPIATMIVLILVARHVSAISFRHSLLLIALASAAQSPFSVIPNQFIAGPGYASPVPIYGILLVGGVLVRVIASWSLAHVETVVSTIRNLLQTTIALIILSSALVGLTLVIGEFVEGRSWVIPILSIGASSLLNNVIVMILTYAVRNRAPNPPEAAPWRDTHLSR